MSLFDYMAKRSLVPDHLAEVRYLAEFAVESATFSIIDVRGDERSNGGGSEASFERQDVEWVITFAPVNGYQLQLLREFLDSTESGQAFTVSLWDEDSEALVLKRLETSHSEDSFVRVGSQEGDYFRATITAIVSTLDGEAIDIYSPQVGGGTGGFDPPDTVAIVGTINFDGDQDPYPPFVEATGVFFDSSVDPIVPPELAGVLNSNGTGVDLIEAYVQRGGGVPFIVVVTFRSYEELFQDAFTSLDVAGLETVLSADASSFFSSENLGAGIWDSQWTIPVLGTTNITNGGTYSFVFA